MQRGKEGARGVLPVHTHAIAESLKAPNMVVCVHAGRGTTYEQLLYSTDWYKLMPELQREEGGRARGGTCEPGSVRVAVRALPSVNLCPE